MKRRVIPAYVATALWLFTGCQAPSADRAELTDQDMADLRGLFDTVVRTVRAGDFAAWAAMFSDDAVFHPPNAPAVAGRAAIQAWAEALPPVAAFDFADVRVWGEGNLAWGTSTIASAFQGFPPDTAKQLVVFRRDAAGGWQVVAVSFNSDLPLPAPTPAGGPGV